MKVKRLSAPLSSLSLVKTVNDLGVAIVIILTSSWLLWGVNIFLLGSAEYSPGEPGDFLSGSVIFLVIYITFLQLAQMRRQDRENAEATVLRAFEVLKPEMEGVAGQVVSKLSAAGVVLLEDDLGSLKHKFTTDRSVFLRELQKFDLNQTASSFNLKVAERGSTSEYLVKAEMACRRYAELLSALENNITELKAEKGAIASAMKSTDIFLAGVWIKGFLVDVEYNAQSTQS